MKALLSYWKGLISGVAILIGFFVGFGIGYGYGKSHTEENHSYPSYKNYSRYRKEGS